MTLFLVGQHEGQELHHFLRAGVHRVGRERGNELHLADISVSREHALLHVEGDQVWLEDLGSLNGTWVNGHRISQKQRLRPGDRILFGNVEVALRSLSVEPGEVHPETLVSHDAVLSDPDDIAASRRLGWEPSRPESVTYTSPDRRMLAAVTEAGRLLVSPQTLEEVFEAVLDTVERVIAARRILLLLCEDEGTVPAVRAARPASRSLERMMLSRTLLDEVIRGKESLLLTDAQDDERFARSESIVLGNVHAALVAPLVAGDRVIGLIYADTADPAVIYDQEQLQVLRFLADLIAVKIQTTRLQEDQRRKELLEREMALAARIQKELLPADLPEVLGYDLFARQTPCYDVGGDLYDVQTLPDGTHLLALGDVCGKGMGAALLMSTVIASLRLLCDETGPLVEMMRRLHRHLFQWTGPTRYVTLFLARLDPRAHRLEYVNAGHNPPMLIVRDGERVELESTGPPVGMLRDSTFVAEEISIPEGALLCVYSDGISEGEAEEVQFGEERIHHGVQSRRDLPLTEVAAGLFEDLAAHLKGGAPEDDVTLLLLRRRPISG